MQNTACADAAVGRAVRRPDGSAPITGSRHAISIATCSNQSLDRAVVAAASICGHLAMATLQRCASSSPPARYSIHSQAKRIARTSLMVLSSVPSSRAVHRRYAHHDAQPFWSSNRLHR